MSRARRPMEKMSAMGMSRLDLDLMTTMKAMAATMALPARLKVAKRLRVTALEKKYDWIKKIRKKILVEHKKQHIRSC
ncbi:hypothetical protein AGMMS50268_24300 [Spirochaetia bacterium]|nr:hypothetical protein AGMMS50268_24300 [Spirochaetia bacterium]